MNLGRSGFRRRIVRVEEEGTRGAVAVTVASSKAGLDDWAVLFTAGAIGILSAAELLARFARDRGTSRLRRRSPPWWTVTVRWCWVSAAG